LIDCVSRTGDIDIFELKSLAEIEEWRTVAAAVWSGDDSHALQSSILLTLHRYGGLLLGARDSAGRMIAILLGFPGLKDGKVVHCSHMLGMLPEWRSKHVGYRMKCRQREIVLAQGLDLIVWTFDPLETLNAHLNMTHLGGISYQYHPNLYGNMDDNFNRGLESDRLTLSWFIRHRAVEERLAGRRPSPSAADLLRAGVPLLARGELVAAPGEEPDQYLRLSETRTGRDATRMLVEVPSNFQTIKRVDGAAARAWRFGIREVLTDLFGRGYAVLDLLVDSQPGRVRRCYYLIGKLDPFLDGVGPFQAKEDV
jgi:predicted GNAT superfamily acetyltransferase